MKEKNKRAFIKGIYEYAGQLKLSAFKLDLESALNEANATDLSYEELIYTLLQKECDYRQEQMRKSRIRIASFPYKKYLEDLDATGMTTRDISEQIRALYGVDVSAETVSNITNRILPLVSEWQNRLLENTYSFIFMDAILEKISKL